jgi:hypothetical protein
MDICVKKSFFKIFTTLDSHNLFENYQIAYIRVFSVLWVSLHQFLLENLRKAKIEAYKKCKISVFVIFGHFSIAFTLIFLGVQTHVTPQNKGTGLYFKNSFADR